MSQEGIGTIKRRMLKTNDDSVPTTLEFRLKPKWIKRQVKRVKNELHEISRHQSTFV